MDDGINSGVAPTPELQPQPTPETSPDQNQKGPESAPVSPEASPERRPEQAPAPGEQAPQAAQAAPPAATPAPPVLPPTIAAPADDDMPKVADDLDVIEMEWVNKAKDIINKTKDDPHAQEAEVEKLQKEYLKKRYGKEIKAT